MLGRSWAGCGRGPAPPGWSGPGRRSGRSDRSGSLTAAAQSSNYCVEQHRNTTFMVRFLPRCRNLTEDLFSIIIPLKTQFVADWSDSTGPWVAGGWEVRADWRAPCLGSVGCSRPGPVPAGKWTSAAVWIEYHSLSPARVWSEPWSSPTERWTGSHIVRRFNFESKQVSLGLQRKNKTLSLRVWLWLLTRKTISHFISL